MVLEDVSFSISAGQIVGLLGPSGSGKSTLLRSIVGNQMIRGGSVSVLGLQAGSKVLRHRVGYMTQSASIYDDLTVQQNIVYFAKVLNLPAHEVDRVLEATDLTSVSRRLALDLSGGQRNRVSLAIALLGSPELVILDEPTVGLDPVLRSELWHLFAQLAEQGMTLLISSHVMDEAMRCDEVLLLREGRLLEQLTPAQLLDRTGTSNPEEAFLKLINSLASANAPRNGKGSRARHRAQKPGAGS